MSLLARIPGARTALAAFVLTVVLGTGGVAAHALWQQSATATMDVSAARSWPGPPVTSLTCANNASKKTATLQLQLPQAAAVTYAASGAASPATYTWGTVGAGTPAGSLSLTQNSPVVTDNPTGPLTLTVTATYTDQTDASATITLTKENNGKIDCP